MYANDQDDIRFFQFYLPHNYVPVEFNYKHGLATSDGWITLELSRDFDLKLPKSLSETILEYFSFQDKLEVAENNNNAATSRRLIEEIKYIKKSLDRDMIRYFELEKGNLDYLKEINSLI